MLHACVHISRHVGACEDQTDLALVMSASMRPARSPKREVFKSDCTSYTRSTTVNYCILMWICAVLWCARAILGHAMQLCTFSACIQAHTYHSEFECMHTHLLDPAPLSSPPIARAGAGLPQKKIQEGGSLSVRERASQVDESEQLRIRQWQSSWSLVNS